MLKPITENRFKWLKIIIWKTNNINGGIIHKQIKNHTRFILK